MGKVDNRPIRWLERKCFAKGFQTNYEKRGPDEFVNIFNGWCLAFELYEDVGTQQLLQENRRK